MATNTPKLDLVKPALTDAADITAANSNWDKIDNLSAYAKATGTGTAILVNTGFFKLADGNSFTFIASANNNGAATTINVDSTGVKSVYKAGTVSAPTFISGKAYTLWYDATGGNFFTKASAEGTASPSDVLAGKTFSNDNDTGLVGTLAGKAAQTYTPGTSNQIISAGQYLAGDQTISGDSDLVAGNIKTGVNIFNVTGTYTSDATAAATDIISGKTAYVNGSKITGTVPTKTAQTFTPGTSNQTIAAGQYLSGAQTIAGDADLTAANIVKDKDIFGVVGTFSDTTVGATAAQILSGREAFVNGAKVTGTIPSKDAATITPSTANQTIAAGQYLSGVQTIAGDADLVAANIKSGVNIFGVTGNLTAATIPVGAGENLNGSISGLNWHGPVNGQIYSMGHLINKSGVVRVKLSTIYCDPTDWIEIQVYRKRSGSTVAIGILRRVTSHGFVLTQDLEVNAGDVLYVWVKGAENRDYGWLQNFTIHSNIPQLVSTGAY